ncbi:Uncharacterised protein [Streptococcus pneumoniae]|nr:Uncharacterised protein [Streptococcus pneumoniae]
MCFTHSFFHFATLRKSLQKPRQRRLLSATSKPFFEFVSFIYNLKTLF